jgi:hypothetical protein
VPYASDRLSNVSSAFGAPMGRRSNNLDSTGKVRVFRVPLNSGGYDSGGAYWGIGGRLYCAEDESGNQTFTRAKSRRAAAEWFKVSDRLTRPLTARDEE